MKWILIALAALLLLIAAVAIAGALLPKRHLASCTARFNQTPASIWRVVTDFAAASTWRADLKSVERGTDLNGHPVWVEIGRNGRLPLEIAELVPERRMVTRIADPGLPFGGSWTFEIAPVEGGSALTITEDGEIHNPVFRTMARFVFGYHATMEAYLKALGKKFGEEVAPDRDRPLVPGPRES